MQRSAVLVGAALVMGLGGPVACGSPARIRLEPVRADPDATCGFPAEADVLFMLVTALGEGPEDVRNVDRGTAMEFGDFPTGTRQLAVEVVGGGGVVRSFGRTAPFDLAALADGAVLPILMAPPEDGCPVGGLSEPRDHPIVIAAGDGVLVVGGEGPDGPLGTAEWYDPATGRFQPIETPAALHGPQGAVGMSAALMPDGRVLLTGGDRSVFAVFHPETLRFDNPAAALFPARSHHASVALDDDHLLLAGGCSDVECMPTSALFETTVLRVSDGFTVDGPTLANLRIGGVALREPIAGDATEGRVLLTGGVDDLGDPAPAERVDPSLVGGAAAGETIGLAGSIVAPLASGSVITAFAPEGVPADGTHSVIVPGVPVPRLPLVDGPRSGGTLTPLEDGGVLVVGGDGVDRIARYHPATGGFSSPVLDGLADVVADLAGHGAARLPDGTVLIVGGHDAGGPRATAALFRPDGDSPFTGAVTVTPAGGETEQLVAFDPLDIDATGGYVITGQGDELRRWVVIAGMRPRTFAVDTTLIVSRGVALLFGLVDAEHLDAVELVVGERPRLVRRDDGVDDEPCTGAEVLTAGELAPTDADDDPLSIRVTVEVGGGTLQVRLGTRLVLDCPLAEPRAGLVGVAALGDAATVTLSTISVTR